MAARGCLPPWENVCVAAPANQTGNRYSYGYNDGIGVDCHEQYAKLGVQLRNANSRRIRSAMRTLIRQK